MISHNHVLKGLRDFIDGRPLKEVTPLSCLVVTGLVRKEI